MTRMETAFGRWLDHNLRQFPLPHVAAYAFNLYEHEDAFAVQVVGASRFDPDDPRWACDEACSSGEDLFYLPHAVVGEEWEPALDAAKALLAIYLEHGTEARVLKSAKAVGIGFVDGDLEVVYEADA